MVNYLDTHKKLSSAPVPIKNVLSRVLKQKGLEAKFAQYDFILYWPQIVGSEVAKRTKPMQIKNGVLTVLVENSIWAQELSFNKKMILNKLHERLVSTANGKLIHDIHFAVDSLV